MTAPADPSRRPRRRRWLLPSATAAVLVGAAAGVPQVASAQQKPPVLARLAPRAVVAKALSARVAGLSGTLQLSANLGLPDLSALEGEGHGQGTSGLSYLSGTHTANVWYGGPSRTRLSVPDGMGETDVIRNGATVWVWRSGPFQAERISLAPHRSRASIPTSVVAPPDSPMPTPDVLAQALLAHLAPSTKVSVATTWVAGRPAYQLALAPTGSDSLVKEALIAVDAGSGLPLRVELLAKGATGPALELGFSQVSFSPPAASNFTFRPPRGAKVVQDHAPGLGWVAYAPLAGPPPLQVVGTGWGTVAVISPPGSAGDHPSRPGPASGQIGGLLQAARPVQGPWGTGRLVTTALVDALVLPDGTVLVGSVTPPALEAVAARQP